MIDDAKQRTRILAEMLTASIRYGNIEQIIAIDTGEDITTDPLIRLVFTPCDASKCMAIDVDIRDIHYNWGAS